jgi:tetratricopeptide (TPR) repeat protein
MGFGAALLAAMACAAGALHAETTQPVYDSGGTGTAQRHLADAARAAYHGRYTEALGETSKALALAPSYGEAFEVRAQFEMEAGLYKDAAADLAHVTAMHPDDIGLGMMRVELALRQGDAVGTMTALKSALALPTASYWHQPYEAGTYGAGSGTHYHVTRHMETYANEYVSIAEQLLHNDNESLAAMQRMLQVEAQDHPEHIMANYCYLAGVVGLLESAELLCQQSIEVNAHDIGQYDSLGFVHVRMKQWDKAIADYNKALDNRADLTLSLYGRGLAKRAKGDIAGGNADIAAATKNEPDIANIMKRLGMTAI